MQDKGAARAVSRPLPNDPSCTVGSPQKVWKPRLAGAQTSAKSAHPELNDENVAALCAYLRRGLRSAFRGQRLLEHDLDDFVQDALVRIIEKSHTFRGKSRFTTWATAVAIRVAYSKLRSRRYRERAVEIENASNADHANSIATPDTSRLSERDALVEALRTAIHRDLTERQRTAVLGELRGIPSDDLAQRLGVNRNALYKLHHDARRKLRTAILEAGFTESEVREHLAD